MGLEQQLLIQVDILRKEGEIAINSMHKKKVDMEVELNKLNRDIEQLRGFLAGLTKVHSYGVELLVQPDEIRKLQGMK